MKKIILLTVVILFSGTLSLNSFMLNNNHNEKSEKNFKEVLTEDFYRNINNEIIFYNKKDNTLKYISKKTYILLITFNKKYYRENKIEKRMGGRTYYVGDAQNLGELKYPFDYNKLKTYNGNKEIEYMQNEEELLTDSVNKNFKNMSSQETFDYLIKYKLRIFNPFELTKIKKHSLIRLHNKSEIYNLTTKQTFKYIPTDLKTKKYNYDIKEVLESVSQQYVYKNEKGELCLLVTSDVKNGVKVFIKASDIPLTNEYFNYSASYGDGFIDTKSRRAYYIENYQTKHKSSLLATMAYDSTEFDIAKKYKAYFSKSLDIIVISRNKKYVLTKDSNVRF